MCKYENNIMKPNKIIENMGRRGALRKNNRCSEFGQSTLYACIEI
jgi:hypothetical protein